MSHAVVPFVSSKSYELRARTCDENGVYYLENLKVNHLRRQDV